MKREFLKRGLWFLFTVGVLFFPMRITVGPEYELTIVNESKTPVANTRVRRVWHLYAVKKRGQEDFYSDRAGRVMLPEVSIYVNNFELLVGSILNFFDLGINASYLRDENIGVFAEGYEEKWFYGGISNNKGTVVLNRLKESKH